MFHPLVSTIESGELDLRKSDRRRGRSCNLLVRSQVLYPVELGDHYCSSGTWIRTKITGVKGQSPTIRRFPNKKPKFRPVDSNHDYRVQKPASCQLEQNGIVAEAGFEPSRVKVMSLPCPPGHLPAILK